MKDSDEASDPVPSRERQADMWFKNGPEVIDKISLLHSKPNENGIQTWTIWFAISRMPYSKKYLRESVSVEQNSLRVPLSDLPVLLNEHPSHNPGAQSTSNAECRRASHGNDVTRRIVLWPKILGGVVSTRPC